MSLLEIKVVDISEPVDPEIEAHAHLIFQNWFEELSLDNLIVAGNVHENFSISTVGAAASYTIGSGATLNTVRPTRIETIRITVGSNDYRLEEVSAEKWSNVRFKSSTAIPSLFYYNQLYPKGTIYFDSSTDTSQTLKLISWKPLAALPGLTSAITYEPGMLEMLRTNLAIRLAPSLDGELSQATIKLASDSYKAVARVNYKAIQGTMDSGLGKRDLYDIRSGSII